MADNTLISRNHLFELIKQEDLKFSKGPADSAEIRDFEVSLKFRLPADYKAFMETFGHGDYKFARMFSPSECADYKESYAENIPEIKEGTLIPFADDYSGAQYCFDYRGSSEKKFMDIPVVLVEWKIEKTTASSFLKFMHQAYSAA